MTYEEIWTEIVNWRFNGGNIPSAKLWVNLRYGQVYNDRFWVFRNATALTTTTGGSATLGSLPADFGRLVALNDPYGQALRYLTPSEYAASYYSTSTPVGAPTDYTVLDGVIKLGPAAASSLSGYQITYQRKWVKLVNNSDVPDLPEEYHYMLVHGGLATGLALANDFTFQFQHDMYTELLASLREAYTSDYGGTVQYARDLSGFDAA